MLKVLILVFGLATTAIAAAADYDILILNGTIYDGTGAPPYAADIAISGDRLSAIGILDNHTAKLVIDASGLAVSPGFFNLLSHAHVSLLTDGRAMSDVLQGVTFEVLSEISFSPLSDSSAELMAPMISATGVEISWRSLAEYLQLSVPKLTTGSAASLTLMFFAQSCVTRRLE
jgi:N-acyl-D-amino-acid deacylase